MSIVKLIESIKTKEDATEIFESVWNAMVCERIKMLREDLHKQIFSNQIEIEEDTIDEGIVVGPNSRAYHKKASDGRYTIHITDVDNKEHRLYAVHDKDGSDEKAKKAATTMVKTVAKRYGVRSWNM